MQARGPRARLVAFAGVGHAPWLMDEAQLAPVRDFLSLLEADRCWMQPASCRLPKKLACAARKSMNDNEGTTS
jgi:hypothetical protein